MSFSFQTGLSPMAKFGRPKPIMLKIGPGWVRRPQSTGGAKFNCLIRKR